MSKSKIDPSERVVSSIVDEVQYNVSNVRRRGQRERVQTLIRGDSMTKQADRDRANIHNILDRAKKTGLLPQRLASPLEGELPAVESFHQAMNIIVNARQAFDALPSKVRQAFENDPAQMLAALENPARKDELVSLGVLNAPQKVEGQGAVAPAAPATSAPQNAGEGAGAGSGGAQ